MEQGLFNKQMDSFSQHWIQFLLQCWLNMLRVYRWPVLCAGIVSASPALQPSASWVMNQLAWMIRELLNTIGHRLDWCRKERTPNRRARWLIATLADQHAYSIYQIVFSIDFLTIYISIAVLVFRFLHRVTSSALKSLHSIFNRFWQQKFVFLLNFFCWGGWQSEDVGVQNIGIRFGLRDFRRRSIGNDSKLNHSAISTWRIELTDFHLGNPLLESSSSHGLHSPKLTDQKLSEQNRSPKTRKNEHCRRWNKFGEVKNSCSTKSEWIKNSALSIGITSN